MAEEFKPIESQEQLNAVIGERLSRVEKKYSEEAAGLRTEIETLTKGKTEDKNKIAELEKKNSEFESKLKAYEAAAVKARIAKEVGIPDSLTDRLRGTTEEELKKDAESLKALLPKASAPQKSTAPAWNGDKKASTDAAYASLARSLTESD